MVLPWFILNFLLMSGKRDFLKFCQQIYVRPFPPFKATFLKESMSAMQPDYLNKKMFIAKKVGHFIAMIYINDRRQSIKTSYNLENPQTFADFNFPLKACFSFILLEYFQGRLKSILWFTTIKAVTKVYTLSNKLYLNVRILWEFFSSKERYCWIKKVIFSSTIS